MDEVEISSKDRRERARLERRIERDRKRGRLSERTKSAIAAQALEEFARSIGQQKINQIQQSLKDDKKSESSKPEISVETTTSQQVISDRPRTPPSVPQDLPSFMADICYDGLPAKFRVYGGFERYL